VGEVRNVTCTVEWGATCTHISQSRAGRCKTVMTRQACARSGARLEVGGAWSSNLVRARPLRESASTTMSVWLSTTKRPLRHDSFPTQYHLFTVTRKPPDTGTVMVCTALEVLFGHESYLCKGAGRPCCPILLTSAASHMTSLFDSSP
jgi:hypothetical protein